MRQALLALLLSLSLANWGAGAQEKANPEQKREEAPAQPDAKSQPPTRSQVFDPRSGNSFFDFCRSGTQQKQICILYMRGLLDGVQLQATLTKQKQVYCQPRGASPEQAIDIVLKFMTDNPGDRHRDARLLTFAALKAAWPCPAGAGAVQL